MPKALKIHALELVRIIFSCLSVKRYEYKDPYVGLNEEKLSTFNDSYWGQIKIMNGALEGDEKDPRYAKVNYLPYFKD